MDDLFESLAGRLTDPSRTATVTLVGDSTMRDPGLAFYSKRVFYRRALQFADTFAVEDES